MINWPEQGPWCSSKESGFYQIARRLSLRVFEQSRWALCSDLYLERPHCRGREPGEREAGPRVGDSGTL